MIRLLTLLAATAALCLAGTQPALAQSEPRPGHLRAQIEVPNDVRAFTEAAEQEFAPPGSNYVDLPAVVVPVTERDRLVAYAFVTIRLHLAANANEWRVREQAHFLMHDLTSISHATPFVRTGYSSFEAEPTRALWEETLSQRLTRDRMERLEILGGDMRLLRS
ncbi:MAG: hypothetical protein JJU26_03270 [Oceanicaulis sp.]|uniref:hypothetical protein n=1 Tax=Glycocaulis sp. TaxID=1969725 RepID=UPI0025B9BBA1|nr:hypothetical protein [Glycocaulis sp.]MCC5980721.1 hypothetical protein [Oceanicaulis sp.]MCH8521092.1 hypothetical protein [Glycocaulis sp.]